ncbi:MAG: LuxR C-terminal-related transcriptional regulator [Bacteroidota bacterium]
MNNDDQILKLTYTEEFIRKDKFNAVYYCMKWNGTNGIYFNAKEPADFIIDILERINEGRRKCYLKNYNTFKNSVYYHLKYEMLTYFGCRTKKNDYDDGNENVIAIDNSVMLSFDDNINYEYDDLGSEDILTNLERDDLKGRLIELFDPNEEVEEIAVLEEILEDKKRREIAEDLGITEVEVTTIQKRIYRKIDRRIESLKIDGIKNVKYN